MTEITHGLVSGLSWAAILGSAMIAVAAVITEFVSGQSSVVSCQNAAAEANERDHLKKRTTDQKPRIVT
jgi:hypothetical protein